MKNFKKRLRQLRKDFPPLETVRVYVRPYGSVVCPETGKRCFGICYFNDDDTIKILIERGDESIMIDTLWHEWAHAIVGPPKRVMHPLNEFWTMFGRITNFYQDA